MPGRLSSFQRRRSTRIGEYWMKASWEKRLYKVSNWCFGITASVLVARLLLSKSSPFFTPGLDAIWLAPGAVTCLAGIALGVLLLRPFYQKVVFGNWPGRFLAGLLSLGALTVAKILADQTIVATTRLPAEWFPRSQEVLTGLFAVLFFLLLFYVLVSFFMFLFFVFVALVEFIGRMINMIEVLPITIRKPEWYNRLSQSSIYLRKNEFVLSTFTTLILVIAIMSALGYFMERKAQYIILLPSFVPNVEGQPGRGRVGGSGAVCKDYSEDAWLRFIDEGKVIVAVPLPDSKDLSRRFAFMVGSCKRDPR
jgi:hypothetical protein